MFSFTRMLSTIRFVLLLQVGYLGRGVMGGVPCCFNPAPAPSPCSSGTRGNCSAEYRLQKQVCRSGGFLDGGCSWVNHPLINPKKYCIEWWRTEYTWRDSFDSNNDFRTIGSGDDVYHWRRHEGETRQGTECANRGYCGDQHGDFIAATDGATHSLWEECG